MRHFSARETEWLQELDGIELAGFWPRAWAFVIDWIIITFLFSVLAMVLTGAYLGIQHLRGKPLPEAVEVLKNSARSDGHPIVKKRFSNGLNLDVENPENNELVHVIDDILIPVLYFGILLWKGKGRTPGKRIMKIRVVSLMHRHITFWHAVERALGYAAAGLELGFGFVQFFIHPYRRCAQDRLAETIVVTERSYRSMQHKFTHPLIPDGKS
jgi:uncharacterized RDD family membrane protein YckC